MKFMLVFYAALWPILLNTLYGAREIDPVTRGVVLADGAVIPLDRIYGVECDV